MLRNRSSRAKSLAREARKNPSAAEAIVWQIIRGGKLGFKFRREHLVGPYRIDFYCAEARLALEMDGEQHDAERDQVRDSWLGNRGIATLRIPNRQFFLLDDDIYRDVVARIVEACKARVEEGVGQHPPHPLPPLPAGEERGSLCLDLVSGSYDSSVPKEEGG